MKKVSLLSLLTVLALSTTAGAHTENPFYMPAEGKVYSKTTIEMGDQFKDADDSTLTIRETLGYGITDRLSVDGSFEYLMDSYMGDDAYKEDGLGQFNLGLKYRYLTGSMLGDAYINYGTSMDEDVWYKNNTYTVGTKLGVRHADYAVAGVVEYRFVDADDDDYNQFVVGVDSMYQFNNMWSANLSLNYEMMDDFHGDDVDDPLYLKPQVNLTTSAGTVSAYYKTDVMGDYEDSFGVKYGVQF
ncbi:MAG: outer membrane beta-barrel protein [Alphaproteobacteria bacterium]